MPKKIGLLTAGGDCQGLNATMRGLGKTLYQNIKDVELYGFLGGFSGMINADYVKLEPHDFSGILTRGGTILGSGRQGFKTMKVVEDGVDKVKNMKKAGDITEDDQSDGEERVQKITDDFIKQIDKIAEDKTAEIMEL